MNLRQLVDSIFSQPPDLGPRKTAPATIVANFALDPRRCNLVYKLSLTQNTPQ
ncbi:MAG: hypothetical protein PHW95_02130 [Patescibacteria group bacterium]|nr:hypothetical protein [Patescibacteria group bacterium]